MVRLVASAAVGLTLLQLGAEPKWYEALPAGRGCLPPRCAAGQMPLALPIVAHGDKLVMIGDGADPKRIHESRDGREWVAVVHDGRWGNNYGAAHGSYRGALWRMGGFVDSAGRRAATNEVWRSTDGRRWQRLAGTPWSPRARAHLVELRDTLWLIGGEPGDGKVWFTVDGATWGSRVARNLPASNPQGVVAHRGALFVLGQGMWDSATNDVWTSRDGSSWTRVAEHASWSARTGAGFGVLKDQMSVVAGTGHNDVWHSADGARWTRATEQLPGPPRSAAYIANFRGGLWVIGGKTGGAGGTGFWDAVWYLK